VSIKKISNKSLSRNFKTRKAPLRVLPLAPFHNRHLLNQLIQKPHGTPGLSKQISSPAIPRRVEKEARTTGNTMKKTGEKKPLHIKPILSLHGTMNALRWILVLIFLYLAAGTAVLMIQEGAAPLKNIIIYSIMGFFTFFMGYLGWMLARDVLVIVSGKKNTRNDAEMEA
jgi:hypothetical protein